MKKIIQYIEIRERSNNYIYLIAMSLVVLVSKIEKIPELSLLAFIAFSSGLTAVNNVSTKASLDFERVIPINVYHQVRSRYCLLFIKTTITCILYCFIYFWIVKKFDLLLIEQIALLFPTSITLGGITIFKELTKTNSTIKIMVLQIVFFAVYLSIDQINALFNIRVSSFGLALINCILSVFLTSIIYKITLKKLKEERGF